MELTMFERLLHLPLLQGLSTQDLSEVMAHVRLDFVNYHPGDEIVMQGEPCKGLIYIIAGSVSSIYTDQKQDFVLKEILPPIGVIEPYNVFGMYQQYSRSYKFETEGTTLYIDKQTLLQRLMVNDIVKINFMNIVCNRYQQTMKTLCAAADENTRDKIIKFLHTYSSVPKGQKELKIKMTTLAEIIHETRLKVSQTLNELQNQGLISLQRETIMLPRLEDFR